MLPLSDVRTFEGNEHSFFCLNQSVDFPVGSVDWAPPRMSRLWCYHLHYFDQLRDSRRSIDYKDFLIHEWIKDNPQGTLTSWEPYTASLRVVNWIAYMSVRASTEIVPQVWLDSLYEQVLWLEKNDEQHILANHYFENIKALLLAGLFFKGKDADRWLLNGRRLLLEQLEEQFLSDGGHYERSPHYHARMMLNLIDIMNGCIAVDLPICEALMEACTDKLIAGLDFMARILLPDGKIPLLNDSSFQEELAYDVLVDYAHSVASALNNHKVVSVLEQQKKLVASTDLRIIDERESGLYGFKCNGDYIIIDCGDIGPSYQPGHTHCDFLSYELAFDKHRVVVDAGVYEYQSGFMRNYGRSTAAHNTVRVSGEEQSEIWGEFRVARRASKLGASIRRINPHRIEFYGQFRGFPRLGGRILHSRRINYDFSSANSYEIVDYIEGKGCHKVESFIHLHPSIYAVAESNKCWILSVHDGMQTNNPSLKEIARVEVMVGANVDFFVELVDSWYCPEFGEKQSNKALVISGDVRLPCRIEYSIKKI